MACGSICRPRPPYLTPFWGYLTSCLVSSKCKIRYPEKGGWVTIGVEEVSTASRCTSARCVLGSGLRAGDFGVWLFIGCRLGWHGIVTSPCLGHNSRLGLYSNPGPSIINRPALFQDLFPSQKPSVPKFAQPSRLTNLRPREVSAQYQDDAR